MSRVYLQPGYVLHRRPFRDTSLLLDIWTAQFGRVGLVARGARRQRAKRQSTLEPFRPLLFSWSGRGELHSLTAAESHGANVVLMGQYLLSGLYVNELMQRLCHRDDPHPELYCDYEHILSALALLSQHTLVKQQNTGNSRHLSSQADNIEEQKLLRLFEKRLLNAMGYGLLLDQDAETGLPINENDTYSYLFEQGPISSRHLGAHGASLTITGRSLLALAQESLNDMSVLREIKQLMRAALDLHLGGRSLQSRNLRQSFEQIKSPGSKKILSSL